MLRTKQNQVSHENSDHPSNKHNDPLFKAARASVEDSKSLLLLSSAMSKAIKAKHNAQERIIRSAKTDEDNQSFMSTESSSSSSASSQLSKLKSNPLQNLLSRRRQHHRHQLALDNNRSENSPFPTASVSTPTLRSKSKAISRRLVNFLPLKHNHNKYSSLEVDSNAAAPTTKSNSSSPNSKPALMSQKSLEFEALLEEYPTRTIKASLTPCTAA